jgi:hypothetical protein
MDSVIEARRAKFEAAMEAADKNPGQWLGGHYQNQYGQVAWEAYNAALDSLVVDLPLEACNGMMNGERVRQAIEKAGVKTK